MEYDGKIPDGFSIKEIPASDYLVFSYPAFDFMKENNEVMAAVEKLAWGFDPGQMGYEWNEDCMPGLSKTLSGETGISGGAAVRKKL